MNYKRYIKEKKLNRFLINLCSFAVYIIFIFYILQLLEFANVIDFNIPFTNVILADKIYLKAILATLVGNRVLGFCYHGINLFVGIALGYSSVCTLLKNKLDYTFFYYIPVIIYFIDIVFGIINKEYILCAVHAVLALLSLLTSVMFRRMKILNDLTWGEKE